MFRLSKNMLTKSAIVIAVTVGAALPAAATGTRPHHHYHAIPAHRGAELGYAPPSYAPPFYPPPSYGAPPRIPAPVSKRYYQMRYDWQLSGHSGS